MENFFLGQTIPNLFAILSPEMQNLLEKNQEHHFARENHNENLQQAKDNREFARENHNENLQQAKDNRKFTKENHENLQRIALDKRRVSLTNEETNLFSNNSNMEKLLALNEQKIASAKTKTKKIKAENVFSQCLIANKHSSNITVIGIPQACEDPALELQLLGCDAKVDALIAGFKKIINPEHTK